MNNYIINVIIKYIWFFYNILSYFIIYSYIKMEAPNNTSTKPAKTGRKRNGIIVDGTKVKELS